MIKSNIKRVGLGLILAGGFALASVANINAQSAPPPPDAPRPTRNAPRPPRPNERVAPGDPAGITPNGDLYAAAREQGMRDGQSIGADDRNDRDAYRPEKSGRYKKATNGYNRSYGDKDAYRDAYRQGFLRGYENAYRGETPGMPNGAMPGDRPAPPPAGERPPRSDARAPRPGKPAPPPADRAPRPNEAAAPPDGQPKPPMKDGKRPKPPAKDPNRRDTAPPPAAEPNAPAPAPPTV